MLFRRISRLKPLGRRLSSSSLSDIRNVGIFAHIDAGKTTTTERMLYYSGFTPCVGEVHRGDTVMDYMEEERSRGITISSAAITFPWKNYRVNLIDTPGHVDFTLEVERSLLALDGGILIIDASAGVQAQTLTVWRQVKRHALPKIAFINKMDKFNANLEKSLCSLTEKLGVSPLLSQWPIIEGGSFKGLIDLIKMETLYWQKGSMGKKMIAHSLSLDSHLYDVALEKRVALIDGACNFDDQLAELVLSTGDYSNISHLDIQSSLRKISLCNENALIVLVGSSYKNIGVQPLMDAIGLYLPAPTIKPSKGFLGMAFKIIHHPNKGALTFVRIYSGSLKVGDLIYNVNRDTTEKIQQLMVAFADDFRTLKEVSEGNIAVISGFKESVTGDTLTGHKTGAKELIGFKIPNPVMYCTIEPPSLSKQAQFDLALKNLSREDPSFKYTINETSGQIILSGMGELHIEVMRNRIESEYKVDADLGPLMIAYRESPTTEAEITHEFVRNILNNNHHINVSILVRPVYASKLGESQPTLILNSNKHPSLAGLFPWQIKSIKNGFNLAISSGPLISSPVVDAEFEILSIEINGRSKDTIIASAIMESVNAVLKNSNVRLLEPIMMLEISSDVQESAKICKDIIMKRGHLINEEMEPGGLKLIQATMPLSELKGYSQRIRTMTSGKANFGMEISHYEFLDYTSQEQVVNNVFG